MIHGQANITFISAFTYLSTRKATSCVPSTNVHELPCACRQLAFCVLRRSDRLVAK